MWCRPTAAAAAAVASRHTTKPISSPLEPISPTTHPPRRAATCCRCCWRSWASRRPRCTATSRRSSGWRRWTGSRAARCPSCWPPTWPPGGWTSPPWIWSLITTCPSWPATMCTGALLLWLLGGSAFARSRGPSCKPACFLSLQRPLLLLCSCRQPTLPPLRPCPRPIMLQRGPHRARGPRRLVALVRHPVRYRAGAAD